MSSLKGWRYTVFIGGFVGFLGLALYPIVVSPMLDASEYSRYILKTFVDLRENKKSKQRRLNFKVVRKL